MEGYFHQRCLCFTILVTIVTCSFLVNIRLYISKIVVLQDKLSNGVYSRLCDPASKSRKLDDLETISDEIAEGRWEPAGKIKLNHCRHCPPINCCDPNRTRHLVYKFNNDSLNHLNARKELKRKLMDRNISVFGDSLQRQFFHGLAETLVEENAIKKTTIFDTTNKVSSSLFFVPYGSARGWLQHLSYYKVDTYSNKGVQLWISEETLSRVFNLSEIIIINIGLHYDNVGLGAFHQSLNNIGRLLKAHLKQNPDKVVIFRGTTPQHFISSTGSGLYKDYGFKGKSKCAKKSANTKHPSNPILEYTAQKYGFKFLDTFQALKDRWDLHPGDCTHYCYSKEFFEPQLLLLSLLL